MLEPYSDGSHGNRVWSDEKINELADKCRKGEILCGECKMCLTQKINVFLEEHQDKREKAKDVIADMAYDGFEW